MTKRKIGGHRVTVIGDKTLRPVGGKRIQVTVGQCYQCGERWPCKTELERLLAECREQKRTEWMPPYAFHDLGIALSKTCVALMTVAGWGGHEDDPYVRKTLDEADEARAAAKLDIASMSAEIKRLEAEIFGKDIDAEQPAPPSDARGGPEQDDEMPEFARFLINESKDRIGESDG